MHLALDTVLCRHPLYCFAAATSSVWVLQINDQQVKWTPPIQNAYRSVTNGWATLTGGRPTTPNSVRSRFKSCPNTRKA
jgi:hypothetical protein